MYHVVSLFTLVQVRFIYSSCGVEQPSAEHVDARAFYL